MKITKIILVGLGVLYSTASFATTDFLQWKLIIENKTQNPITINDKTTIQVDNTMKLATEYISVSNVQSPITGQYPPPHVTTVEKQPKVKYDLPGGFRTSCHLVWENQVTCSLGHGATSASCSENNRKIYAMNCHETNQYKLKITANSMTRKGRTLTSKLVIGLEEK